MIHAKRKTAGLSILILAAAVAAGCESDPRSKQSTRALGTLTDTRSELVAARAEVERVLANLGKLDAQPANLTPAFKDYKSSVDAVDRRSETLDKRLQDMRLRAQEYSDAWAAESQQITAPEVRDLSEARNRRVSAQYEKADASAQAVRQAYGPFITQARDVETFLEYDLTYGGVRAAAPYFDTVRSSGADLLRKIDAMMRDLDATEARLSPTTKAS